MTKIPWIGLLAMLLAGCVTDSGTGGRGSGGSGTGAPNVYVARGAEDVQKIAVMPFRAATELVGSSVSDLWVTELLQMGRYDVMERSQMSAVLGETEVSLSGLTSGQAAQVGQMIGAEAVVLGTVSEYEKVAMGGRTYPVVGISARMIDAQTGRILWSVDYSARGSSSSTLSRQARAVVQSMAQALNHQL